MSQSSAMPYPRDDNLRLILAEGHEAWLHKKIAATKQRMVLMIAATALAVAGLSGVMGYWFDGREPGAVTTNLIVVTSLVFVAVLISGVYACQSYRKLAGYRLSRVDHREFLRLYNRL